MASLKYKRLDPVELPADFEPPDGLCAVAAYGSSRAAHEAGLAILAMGRAYWTLVHGEAYVLCVAERDAAAARRELDDVARLAGRGRGGGMAAFAEHRFGWRSFVAYAVLLVACFAGQSAINLLDLGRTDAEGIIANGEWWRTATALTLHGDVVHLASNLVAGVGFVLFVARFFGAAAGWLLVLLSGIAGNWLNAWVQYPEPHFSVGASTAVFGAVGLLTGIGVWAALAEPRTRLSLPRWWVPLFGGLTLLGWLGLGDYRTDVAAHISGFLCGSVFGLLGAFGRRWVGRLQAHRFWVGAIPLLIVAAAWIFAFAAGR